MALFRFFRPPKHQRYEYKPRFYDPAKEDLQERLRMVERAKENDPEAVKARISAGLSRRSAGGGSYRVSAEARRQTLYRSNMRLVLVFVFLVVGTILVLLKFLPTLLNYLEN
ncbi:MAG: hypothetical protein AAGH79_13815 [Bacteroidota bacterium]